VESTERALKSMLDLAHPVAKTFQHHGQTLAVLAPNQAAPSASPSSGDFALWIPPIQRTVATDGTGLPGLIESIQAHAVHLRQSGEWLTRERDRLEAEFELSIQEMLVARFRASIPEARLDEMLESIQNRKISPREAVNVLLKGSGT
jgi:putative protein kinase ArgK-like GTPase of G3E family